MPFDPTQIPEDGSQDGHLDDTPIYEVLLGILAHEATGRFSINGPSGANHMYFMKGRPVGVQLADYFHPLGQLLLEIGRIDAATFIRAQRLISEGNRLPGQVFMELGVLDEAGLQEVLALQANRKADEFCRFGSRPFTFGRGLTFLTGFQSTPLNVYAVIYLAVRQHMGPASRNVWLSDLADKQVRIDDDDDLLPAPLETFGFGPPEERFLQRIRSDWQDVGHLAETGTLPKDDMAVLLRFLAILERLRVRDKPAPAPPAPAAPEPLPDEVFSSSPGDSPPRPSTAPQESTDPRGRAGENIHDIPTALKGKPVKPKPKPKAPPRDGAPASKGGGVSSVIVAPDLLDEKPPPVKKKKKRRKRRSEPLPSQGQSAVSELKKEKTEIGPMPTIVIEDEG